MLEILRTCRGRRVPFRKGKRNSPRRLLKIFPMRARQDALVFPAKLKDCQCRRLVLNFHSSCHLFIVSCNASWAHVARLACAFPGTILTVALVLTVIGATIAGLRWNVVNNTSDLLSDKVASKHVLQSAQAGFRQRLPLHRPDPVAGRGSRTGAPRTMSPLIYQTLKPQPHGRSLSKIDFRRSSRGCFSPGRPTAIWRKSPSSSPTRSTSRSRARTRMQKARSKWRSISIPSLSEATAKFNDPTYLHKKE